MRKASQGASAPALSNKQQLVEAINELIEATYVADFLSGTLSREDSQITLTVQEICGFANVIDDLKGRINKAMSVLMEVEGSCHD